MEPTSTAVSHTILQAQNLIFVPLLCAGVFLIIRVILFFVEERELRLHARTIFAHALKFTPTNDLKKASELFVVRLTFYTQLIVHKKVYLTDLEKLLSFVDESDPVVAESITFLKNAAK